MRAVREAPEGPFVCSVLMAISAKAVRRCSNTSSRAGPVCTCVCVCMLCVFYGLICPRCITFEILCFDAQSKILMPCSILVAKPFPKILTVDPFWGSRPCDYA